MRVLLITGSHPMDLIGGAELQTLMIANGLLEYGYESTFLAADANEQSRARINNLDVIKIPGRSKVGSARHKKYLETAILESRPDVCYVRTFNELMWALPICNHHAIPVVTICCSGRDISPFPSKLKPRRLLANLRYLELFRRYLNFRSMRLSDEIFCNTNLLWEGIRRWYPDMPGGVIYNGHPIPPQEEIHKGYSRRVIWVNNIKRIKRPEIFIKLAGCFPDVEFVMIGRLESTGRYMNYVRALIEHASSNLNYLGCLAFDKVNLEISMSDILFYTSDILEGFGNSLIQAWMRGVPTISLNYDPDGIIERESIGRCSNDFSQLVNDTGELIGNPVVLCEMSERAREYAKTNHDSKRMISQYEMLFRELYDQKPKQLFPKPN